MNCDVTVEVSTKDRYFTTLPLTINSIISQTVSPKRLLIYDDGEHKDLRGLDPYPNLFKMLDVKNIRWEVVFGDRKGQVHNHQKAIYMSDTKYIWRLDDDNVAQVDVLEKLLEHIEKYDKIGAIGGLVIDPHQDTKNNNNVSNKIADIFTAANRQWYEMSETVPFTRDVEHLYSSFLFRKDAASHGYCLYLSQVGHREETLFTYEMFKNGWKLALHPKVVTWHYRSPSGGIRSFNDSKLWEHDEEVFRKRLNFLEKNERWAVLDNGLGDHFVFKSILSEVLEKDKSRPLHLACCYPNLFLEEQLAGRVVLHSIAEARNIIGNTDKYSVYLLGCHLNLPLVELFRRMYVS